MSNSRELPSANTLFESEAFLSKAIDNFNSRGSHTITDAEAKILRTNRELAKAVFSDGGGLMGLIDAKEVSIAELNLKPQALLNVLQHPAVRNSISNGAFTARDVISRANYTEAEELLRNHPGESGRIAAALGFEGANAQRVSAALKLAAVPVAVSVDSFFADMGVFTPGPGRGR